VHTPTKRIIPLPFCHFQKKENLPCEEVSPKEKGHKRDFFLLSLFVFVQLKIVSFALLRGREKKKFMVLEPYKLSHHSFGEEKT
jgi:hypothetical protein